MRAAVAFASAAGDEVALVGDFNARLGSVVSQTLGAHDKHVETKNSAMFRQTSKVAHWSLRSFSQWSYLDFEQWHRASHRLHMLFS